MKGTVLNLCNCRLIPINSERVLLKSAHKTLELKSKDIQKLLECLLPKLNGKHSQDEIINQIPAELRKTAEELIEVLDKERFLKQDLKNTVQQKLAKVGLC